MSICDSIIPNIKIGIQNVPCFDVITSARSYKRHRMNLRCQTLFLRLIFYSETLH